MLLKKSLLLIWPERGEYPKKQQVETLPKSCATILLSHTPMCIKDCWRWGKNRRRKRWSKSDGSKTIQSGENNNFLKRDHARVCIFDKTVQP